MPSPEHRGAAGPGPQALVTVAHSMKTWLPSSGQKLDVFIPFLGKLRPLTGRCCQACTPQSWEGFHQALLSPLGFRNIARVSEEDTRFRGWLVRRLCCVLAVWGWKVPTSTPGDLAERVCSSMRVRDAAAGLVQRSGGDSGSQQQWKDKVLGLLAGMQAPLSIPVLRLCCWALLRLLGRLFLSVQLHRGQLEMVLRAARTPGVPLVFLSVHRSQLDGLLLSFLLFSQGLGVPRVAVGGLACSPRLRALLRCLGGVFLPAGMEQRCSSQDRELPAAVLGSYVGEVLRSQQPLVLFLEEPCTPRHLCSTARVWLSPLCRAVQDGTVPDVLLVPVGIAYDLAPGSGCRKGAHGAQPLGIPSCLWALGRALCRALCRRRSCARVDFAQPYSLQEFMANSRSRIRMGQPRGELLVPTILSVSSRQPEGRGAEEPAACSAEAEEEMMVTMLGLHALRDAVACSAVTAVGITAALLLHRHQQGVRLSRLMVDFAWLLEETLLRQHDAAFSGQLRALVLHSLTLLGPHLSLYRLVPPGDVLVVPEASAEARWELSQHSAELLPVFAGEAVGACAVRALLLELLPFVGDAAAPSGLTFSQEELHHRALVLLWLLPRSLLGLQPCQPLDRQSEDVLDKLILCGLLEAEEPEGERYLCDVSPGRSRRRPWAEMDFTDSDSGSEDSSHKRCFKVREPEGSPGFLLFLCRLLSPVLGTYAQAVAFLELPSWPQPEAACAGALQQFLLEGDGLERPTRSLALSTLRTFKDIGVLEETPSPSGPLLHLTPPFRSSEARGQLHAFILQFVQP